MLSKSGELLLYNLPSGSARLVVLILMREGLHLMHEGLHLMVREGLHLMPLLVDAFAPQHVHRGRILGHLQHCTKQHRRLSVN
jgi:hypothetical protein